MKVAAGWRRRRNLLDQMRIPAEKRDTPPQGAGGAAPAARAGDTPPQGAGDAAPAARAGTRKRSKKAAAAW